MIRKECGEFVAMCDLCEEGRHYGGVQDDFLAFVDEIKRSGWSISKQSGEWSHFCPDCTGTGDLDD